MVQHLANALFVVANILVLSSMFVLGVTGTYLGDYFGILMKARVTGFPFNIMENPMYNGATLNFLALALWCDAHGRGPIRALPWMTDPAWHSDAWMTGWAHTGTQARPGWCSPRSCLRPTRSLSSLKGMTARPELGRPGTDLTHPCGPHGAVGPAGAQRLKAVHSPDLRRPRQRRCQVDPKEGAQGMMHRACTYPTAALLAGGPRFVRTDPRFPRAARAPVPAARVHAASVGTAERLRP